MNPKHDVCGTTLYPANIYYKSSGKTIRETIPGQLYCKKCKKFVSIEVRQKGWPQASATNAGVAT